MAYEDYEESATGANPVELYLFRYGQNSDAYFAYTTALAEITYDGIVYSPIPISRTDQTITGRPNGDTQGIEITVSRTTEISQLFAYYPPSYVVKVIVRKGNVADPTTPSAWLIGENFPVEFMGRVLEGVIEGQERKLSCSQWGNSLKRPGLRRNYQLSCAHVLYGPRCLASKAAATTSGTVVSVASNQLQLAPGWMKPDTASTDYIGGMIEWAGDFGPEYRDIIAVSGDTLSLSGPIRFMVADDIVDVLLGCPHTEASCSSLHANILNYGGQSNIPLVNPIGKNTFD